MSKELKNGIETFVGQVYSYKLWIGQNYVLINNSRIAWPTCILMPFLSSLDNFLYWMHVFFFFKRGLIILRLNKKYANFWLGGQYLPNGIPADFSQCLISVESPQWRVDILADDFSKEMRTVLTFSC